MHLRGLQTLHITGKLSMDFKKIFAPKQMYLLIQDVPMNF